MKRNRNNFFIGFILLITLLVGYNLISRLVAPESVSESLLAYFPQQIGTVWAYNGFAEYSHQMKLDSIVEMEKRKRIILEITGNVGDPSGGESIRDFDFKIRYIITSTTVYENIVQADTPFPHILKNVAVLKLPIRKGAKWQQTVTIDGKEQVLRAEIIEVRTDRLINGQNVRVRYRVPIEGMPNGVYEEIREFGHGIGIVWFEKTFGVRPTERFSYVLYKVTKPKI